MDNRTSHPADIADHLERLSPEQAQQNFRELSAEQGAAVLAELEPEARPEMLSGLTTLELTGLVQELSHDDAADVISGLEPEQRSEVLDGLSSEDTGKISQLLSYPPDTAGGIMSDRFIALRSSQTIAECLQLLRGRGEDSPDDISYLYVVDGDNKLKGIVSLRDLVLRRPERTVGEIMHPEVQHVQVDDDKEKIAHLFEHYHYMALPVLEHDGRLVGLVLASQAIDVLQDEATEDMQLMVGLSGEERALTPWSVSIRKRLPWLCINLGTAFVAGSVVGAFEQTIAAWTALAIFLPIVAGQGGNAAAQTLTVIIRDMALGELSVGDGKKALLKEITLGLLNGTAIGLIVGVSSYLWKGSPILACVVGVAMLLNMIAAALAGVLIPYTLKACRIDPALASTIIVTTVTDVGGFLFFLGLASLVKH
jgi:magnesium transporter